MEGIFDTSVLFGDESSPCSSIASAALFVRTVAAELKKEKPELSDKLHKTSDLLTTVNFEIAAIISELEDYKRDFASPQSIDAGGFEIIYSTEDWNCSNMMQALGELMRNHKPEEIEKLLLSLNNK